MIDLSDPSDPSEMGNLPIGGSPTAVVSSGNSVFVIDSTTSDLKIIDVSDPADPTLSSSIAIGQTPTSIDLSGLNAVVVDKSSDDLKVITVAGIETTALNTSSLATSHLQVNNDIATLGNLSVSGGVNIGEGGLYSNGGIGVNGSLALANSTAPKNSPANLIQLYAEDVAGSSELKVRDEASNITTLSPHNFSLIGSPSEPLAWSYYSENSSGQINVDMLRAIRLLEAVTGEKLVFTSGYEEQKVVTPSGNSNLRERINALETQNRQLKVSTLQLRLENYNLRKEIERIKSILKVE